MKRARTDWPDVVRCDQCGGEVRTATEGVERVVDAQNGCGMVCAPCDAMLTERELLEKPARATRSAWFTPAGLLDTARLDELVRRVAELERVDRPPRTPPRFDLDLDSDELELEPWEKDRAG